MKLLRTLTIRQQLTLALVASSAVVVTLVGLSQLQTRQMQGMQDETASRAEDAILITEASGTASMVYSPIADAQLSGDVAGTRQEWNAVKEEAKGDLEACEKAAQTPEQKAWVREARASYEAIVDLFERQMAPKIEAAKGSTPETFALDDQIDVQTEKMEKALASFVAALQTESKEANARFDSTTSTYATVGLVVGILGLVMAIGVGAFVTVNVSRTLGQVVMQMREGAEQVMSAATQVAGSSQSLSQGATEQAASLEETSASMEEMASMTRMNADNAHQAATLMAEVDTQVATSNRMLGQMVTAMASIRDSSAKVSKIIKTIDEIAFQTNILALNAAVEAARAGEAGMGFAVVADEVRNLAQRAAQAARDTASLIDEARQNAEQGGQTVEQVAAAITQFTASVSKVKGIAEEVNSASRQQAQGIDQVTQAIAQMEKVTQTTAATAEESAAASEELNAQAEVTVQLVRDLEAMVGGASAAPATVRRRPAKTPAPATSKVLALHAKPAKASKSAEDIIPLEDTGSFGRF